jgi:hypothetical protein
MDLDQRVRLASFTFLEEQTKLHGETLPRTVLAQGFDFDGRRVPLLGPEGIFKPAILPSMMPMKNGGRWSVSDEYGEVVNQLRETAIFWSPADNNELGTRNRINEYLRFEPTRIHPITKQPGSARLLFVRNNDTHPNGVLHILRETRNDALKIGTDLGKPVFNDERDPNVPDHGYDCLRYMVASRSAPPREQRRTGGPATFHGARRLMKRYRREMTIR